MLELATIVAGHLANQSAALSPSEYCLPAMSSWALVLPLSTCSCGWATRAWPSARAFSTGSTPVRREAVKPAIRIRCSRCGPARRRAGDGRHGSGGVQRSEC